MIQPIYSAPTAAVYCTPWEGLVDVAAASTGPRALLVDAPYSPKTHEGHDVSAGAAQADGAARRELSYKAWTPADVARYVAAWAPLIDGWFVSVTDETLLPAWRDAMAAADRTVFQDVPACIRGMTVRLCGGGPSSWCVHLAVSRPRSLKWPTLRGYYEGARERPIVPGGKPLWLMEQIVADYTRPGDLVIDTCAGGGTTLAAGARLGRRVLGGDASPVHADVAASWLRDGRRPQPVAGMPDEPDDEGPRQDNLFAYSRRPG